MNDVRSEFEAWTSQRYYLLARDKFGGYLSQATEDAWQTWQSATKRVPMTDEQVFADVDIMAANARIGARMPDIMRMVRAIEAHLKGTE
jgi:hypothetical protein